METLIKNLNHYQKILKSFFNKGTIHKKVNIKKYYYKKLYKEYEKNEFKIIENSQ